MALWTPAFLLRGINKVFIYLIHSVASVNAGVDVYLATSLRSLHRIISSAVRSQCDAGCPHIAQVCNPERPQCLRQIHWRPLDAKCLCSSTSLSIIHELSACVVWEVDSGYAAAKSAQDQSCVNRTTVGLRSMQPLQWQWARSACDFIDFKGCVVAAGTRTCVVQHSCSAVCGR